MEGGFYLFELFVYVLLTRQEEFVGRFGDFVEKSAHDFFLVLSANVQVLVVL